MGKPYDFSCDMFSFGMVLFELLTENMTPYGSLAEHRVNSQVAEDALFRPQFPASMEQSNSKCISLYVQLVKQCWQHQSTARPNASQVVQTLEECYSNVFEE